METARASTVKGPWAARIDVSQATAAVILRLRPNVRAAIVADSLWLRGDHLDAELDRLLDFVAPNDRFEIDPGDQLRSIGHSLPTGVLPKVAWQPVAEVFHVTWPTADGGSALRAGVALRLVRSSREQLPNALLTELAAFERWVNFAAAIRLAPLRFAATATRALVLGQPVPPIDGVRLYESSGIIVPCGWQTAPTFDPPSLRQFLNLPPNDLVLFGETGWQLIRAEHVVSVSRSAVRLTVRGADHA